MSSACFETNIGNEICPLCADDTQIPVEYGCIECFDDTSYGFVILFMFVGLCLMASMVILLHSSMAYRMASIWMWLQIAAIIFYRASVEFSPFHEHMGILSQVTIFSATIWQTQCSALPYAHRSDEGTFMGVVIIFCVTLYIVLAISTQVHHCVRHRDTPSLCASAKQCMPKCCKRCCRGLLENVSTFENRWQWQRYTTKLSTKSSTNRVLDANLANENLAHMPNVNNEVQSQSMMDDAHNQAAPLPVELVVSRPDQYDVASNTTRTGSDQQRPRPQHAQQQEPVPRNHNEQLLYDDEQQVLMSPVTIDMQMESTAAAEAESGGPQLIPRPLSSSADDKKGESENAEQNLSPKHKPLTPTSNLKSVHTSSGSSQLSSAHKSQPSNSQPRPSPKKQTTASPQDGVEQSPTHESNQHKAFQFTTHGHPEQPHHSLMMHQHSLHADTPTASNNDASLQPIHEDQSVPTVRTQPGFAVFERPDSRRRALSSSSDDREQAQEREDTADVDSLLESTTGNTNTNTKVPSPTDTAEYGMHVPANKASLTTIASTQSYEYSSRSESVARGKRSTPAATATAPVPSTPVPAARAHHEERSESSSPGGVSPPFLPSLPQEQESNTCTAPTQRLSLAATQPSSNGPPQLLVKRTTSTETSVWPSQQRTRTVRTSTSTPIVTPIMRPQLEDEAPPEELLEQPAEKPPQQATTTALLVQVVDDEDDDDDENGTNVSTMHRLDSDTPPETLASPVQPSDGDVGTGLTLKPRASFVSHSSNASLNFSNAYEEVSPTLHPQPQRQRRGSQSNTNNAMSNMQLPLRRNSATYTPSELPSNDTAVSTGVDADKRKTPITHKKKRSNKQQKMFTNWDTLTSKAKDERQFLFSSAIDPNEAIGDATYYHMVDILNTHSRSRSKTDIRLRKTADFPPQVNTQLSRTELEHATPRPEVSTVQLVTRERASPPMAASTAAAAGTDYQLPTNANTDTSANVNASSDMSGSPSPASGPGPGPGLGGVFQSLPVAQTDLAVYLRVHQALLDTLTQQQHIPGHRATQSRAAPPPRHSGSGLPEPQNVRMGTIRSQISTSNVDSNGSLSQLSRSGLLTQLEARKESPTEMAFNMTFMVCSPMFLMEVWNVFHCMPHDSSNGETYSIRAKTNSLCHRDFWYFFALFLIALWYAYIASAIYRSRRFIRATFEGTSDHLHSVYRGAFGDKSELFYINNVKLTRWWYGYVPLLLQSLVVCICVMVTDINGCLETLTLLLLLEFVCMRVVRPWLSASDRLCQFLLRTFVLLESSILIFCLPYSSGYNIAIGSVGLFWIFMTQIEVCSGLYPLHPNSTVCACCCACCCCCCCVHDDVDEEDSDYELFDDEQGVTPRGSIVDLGDVVVHGHDDDDDDDDDDEEEKYVKRNSITSLPLSSKPPPLSAANATTTTKHADSITSWNAERSDDFPPPALQKRSNVMTGSDLFASQRRKSGQLDKQIEPQSLSHQPPAEVNAHMKYLKEQMSTATLSEEFYSTTSRPTTAALKESKENDENPSVALKGIDETQSQDAHKEPTFRSVPTASSTTGKHAQKARVISDSWYESTVSVKSYDSQTKSITN